MIQFVWVLPVLADCSASFTFILACACSAPMMEARAALGSREDRDQPRGLVSLCLDWKEAAHEWGLAGL